MGSMVILPEIRNRSLVLDLVQWVAKEPRPYDEVMEAWRTSCPRFPVWEDALELGFVQRVCEDGCAVVRVTPAGREVLRSAGRT
jgi:D-3-phosphoglycerate dehydrogenase